MEFVTDLITPAQLTSFARLGVNGGMPFAGVATANASIDNRIGVDTNVLPNLFPVQQTDDIKYEIENSDLSSVGKVARYRSWDTVPPIGQRPGVSIIGGEIVPLAWSERLNEEELQRFSRLRSGLAERSDARVVDAILNDAMICAEAVQNRITLGHAEILQTATMTLTELGNPVAGNALQVVYPVPANQMNVTANPLWSSPTTAKPVDDLKAYEDIYMDANNGVPPDEWWVSRAVAADLLVNTDLLNRLVWAVGTSNAVQLPDVSLVNQIFARVGVQAPIRVVDVRRPALAGGVRSSLLGARLLIGVRAGMGRTLFTTPTVVGMMPGNGQIELSQAAGIVAYSKSGISPPEVMTTAEAIAVPVLSNPNALFVATV